MTEPINVQANVFQGQEMARHSQTQKDVAVHQQMGQEVDQARVSDQKLHQVEVGQETQESGLDKDGSGRGRGFMRQKGDGDEEKKEDESAEARREAEPNKGQRVDFTR